MSEIKSAPSALELAVSPSRQSRSSRSHHSEKMSTASQPHATHQAGKHSPSASMLRFHFHEEEPDHAGAHKDLSLDVAGEGMSAVSLTLDSDRSVGSKQHQLQEILNSYAIADEIVSDTTLSKPVRKYYELQNAQVDLYRAVLNMDGKESAVDREKQAANQELQSGAVRFAIEFSLFLTFVSITLKFFSAIWSDSISIIASAVDSALDVISQMTLMLTGRYMNKREPLKYPIGKSRLETLSVLVFSVIMGLAAVFLMYQSILVFVDGLKTQPENNIDYIAIGLMAFTIFYQTLMYIFCRRVVARGGRNVSAVDAIAQDHLNDVCSNSFGLCCAIVSHYESKVWFMDSVGGFCISLYILARWVMVCQEQFVSLLGRTAETSFLNQLTYLATIHDDRILKVDTVIAYRLGTNLHCEVHIVLPADMPLRTAHDIGESLEQAIERIDEVELAWVHLDFEWGHSAEHDRWNL